MLIYIFVVTATRSATVTSRTRCARSVTRRSAVSTGSCPTSASSSESRTSSITPAPSSTPSLCLFGVGVTLYIFKERDVAPW